MKIFLIALTISSLFSQESHAQDSSIIHLWPGDVPGALASKHPPRVTSNSKGGIIRLTDVTDPSITVFTPAPGRRNGGGVIICPGGGYQILGIDPQRRVAHWLNALGFTAFILAYRVPRQQMGALQDVQRAIRVIRNRAEAWNLDPLRLGVIGFSAGGSLSARISTESNRNWYAPVDEADSLSSKPAFAVLIYPAYLDLGANHTLTPELNVTKETPPMFIFQTADDPYGNSALVMASALRKAKANIELHYYPRGGHGYGMRPGNPAAALWPPLAAQWLTQWEATGGSK